MTESNALGPPFIIFVTMGLVSHITKPPPPPVMSALESGEGDEQHAVGTQGTAPPYKGLWGPRTPDSGGMRPNLSQKFPPLPTELRACYSFSLPPSVLVVTEFVP